jgi:UDP-N-acetylmuramoylalanine--D-glutamate ligase
MAQWLARCGARVRVADTRTEPQRLSALREAVPAAEFIGGAFTAELTAELLDGVDFVAVSPGLAPERELAEITPSAAARNIPVWGEIELFAQALADLKATRGYAPKVIAITGTNGKTTVTSLTGLLCRRAGLSTRVAGNISPAALDVLREVIDADELPQAWVLELSSFQLHTTFSLNPDAATVLNVTQDHLDWHGSMSAYAFDKSRIFGADTVRVLNRDDATVMRMRTTGSRLITPDSGVITFGTGEPDAPGSFGLVNERGVLWLANASPAEEPEKKRRRGPAAHEVVEPVELFINRLMPADALRIRGLHNASNALAALALCRGLQLPLAPLLHGLRDYQGEPHRVELVASIDGVDFYDDSKGTNVGATVAALEGLGKSFGEADRQILLIAGGDGKGQDFSPLAGPCSRYAKAVLLIGRDAPAVKAAIEPSGVPCFELGDLPEAARRAAGLAKPGDVVLLSPACASLDMFTNYAHRAQVFVDAVRELALEKGQDI